jgi:hypothetical protein
MGRTVSDQDGITWSCVEAFTGLSDEAEHSEAAQVKGQEDTYWVICTPSGGASLFVSNYLAIGEMIIRMSHCCKKLNNSALNRTLVVF